MGKSWIAPVIIGIVGAAILVSLGNWQVNRLAWKEGVLAKIDARMNDVPTDVPARPEKAVHLYQPVQMSGQSGARELHVLVSHKRLGPGYRIISAFEMSGGRRVLLDHGFIAIEDKERVRMPVVGELFGNLHWPDDRTSSTPENDAGGNIWFARDLPQMAAALETEPVLVILRSASEMDPAVTPLPLDSAAIPNDHLNYAITWFSLAAIWLGMTGFWLWRIKRRTV